MNLRQALANLRELLGPFLSITRHTVALDPNAEVWVDVAAFEAALRDPPAADLRRLHMAANLYRGDFLGGWYVREAPVFEEWVLTERERLHRMAAQGLHQLARAYTEWWAYDAPSATHLLMLLYVRSSQRFLCSVSITLTRLHVVLLNPGY
ncbi:MAG: hypothetical protein KatS3mg057_2450 [Herpetosiphonaceae bacterium]|nr:MAG: hypothetical protein KatS3mg057_2450 [Herpetosiphonaceae bacterium]